MAFDYKNEYKDLYLPKTEPVILNVPKMKYIAVSGEGNPNDENGEYKNALSVLYGVSYTIKMSYKSGKDIEGYFQYVVPPLEGLWRMGDGKKSIDYNNKSSFKWISMIRLPDFVTADVLKWAKSEAHKKKKLDTSGAHMFEVDEGLCVQCMHIGTYDDEPKTVVKMEAYAKENGCVFDIGDERLHHEIYLSDPRRTQPEKCKTVIRIPIKKI